MLNFAYWFASCASPQGSSRNWPQCSSGAAASAFIPQLAVKGKSRMKRHQSRVKHFTVRLGKGAPFRLEADSSAELGADPHAKARRVAASISTRAISRGLRFLSGDAGSPLVKGA